MYDSALTCTDTFDLNGFAPIHTWCRDLLGLIKLRFEQCVDQRRFSETGFT